MIKLFVANLDFKVTEAQIKGLFEGYGIVDKCHLAKDRETGKSRGFAFVDMSDGGRQAINGLNGIEVWGRTLSVKEAEERQPR